MLARSLSWEKRIRMVCQLRAAYFGVVGHDHPQNAFAFDGLDRDSSAVRIRGDQVHGGLVELVEIFE